MLFDPPVGVVQYSLAFTIKLPVIFGAPFTTENGTNDYLLAPLTGHLKVVASFATQALFVAP